MANSITRQPLLEINWTEQNPLIPNNLRVSHKSAEIIADKERINRPGINLILQQGLFSTDYKHTVRFNSHSISSTKKAASESSAPVPEHVRFMRYFLDTSGILDTSIRAHFLELAFYLEDLDMKALLTSRDILNAQDIFNTLEYYLQSGLTRPDIITWFAEHAETPNTGLSARHTRMLELVAIVYYAFCSYKHRSDTPTLGHLPLEQIRSRLQRHLLDGLQIPFEVQKSEVMQVLVNNGKQLKQTVAEDISTTSSHLRLFISLTNAAGKTLEDLANHPTITNLPLLKTASFEERTQVLRAALQELHQDCEYPIGTVEHSIASTVILYSQQYGWSLPDNLREKPQLMEAFQQICNESDKKEYTLTKPSYDPRDYAALHLVYAMGVEEDLKAEIFEDKLSKATSIEERIRAKIVTSEEWYTKIRSHFAEVLDAEYGFGIASKPSKQEFALNILKRLTGWSESVIKTLKRTNVPYTENGVRGIRKKYKSQTLLEEFLDRADNYYYKWPNPGYRHDPIQSASATISLPTVPEDHNEANIVVRNLRARQINAGMELEREEKSYNSALPQRMLGLAKINLWKAKIKWSPNSLRSEIDRLVANHNVETQDEFERKKNGVELRHTLEGLLVPGLDKLDEAIIAFKDGNTREGMLSLLAGYATFLGTVTLGEFAGQIGRVGEVNRRVISKLEGASETSAQNRAQFFIAENVLHGFNVRPKHLINALIEDHLRSSSPTPMKIFKDIILNKKHSFDSSVPEEFRNLAPNEIRNAIHPITKNAGQVRWVLVPSKGNTMRVTFLQTRGTNTYQILDWKTGKICLEDGIFSQQSNGVLARAALPGGGKVQQRFTLTQQRWQRIKQTVKFKAVSNKPKIDFSFETDNEPRLKTEKTPRPLTLSEQSEIQIQQHETSGTELINQANKLFQTIETLQAERNASFEIETELRKMPSEDSDSYINNIINRAQSLTETIEIDQTRKSDDLEYEFEWGNNRINGKADQVLPTLRSIIAISKRSKTWKDIQDLILVAAKIMDEAAIQIDTAKQLRHLDSPETVVLTPPLPQDTLYRPNILVYEGKTKTRQAVRDNNTYPLAEIEQWVKAEYEKPLQDRDRDGLIYHGRLPNSQISNFTIPSGETVSIEQLKGDKFYWVTYLTDQGEKTTKIPLPIVPFEARGITHYNPEIAEVRFGKPNLNFHVPELQEQQLAIGGGAAETQPLQAKFLEQRYSLTGDFSTNIVDPISQADRVTQWKPINSKLKSEHIPSEPVQIRETTENDSEAIKLYYYNSDGVLTTNNKWYKKSDLVLLYRQTLQKSDRSLIKNWHDSENFAPDPVILSLPHPDPALAQQQIEIAKFQIGQDPIENLQLLLGIEEYEVRYIDVGSDTIPREQKIRLLLPKLMTESYGIMKVKRWGDGHFDVQFGKPVFRVQNANEPVYAAVRYMTKPGFIKGTRGGVGISDIWQITEYSASELKGMVIEAYPEFSDAIPSLIETQTQESVFSLSPADSQLVIEALNHKANTINKRLSFLLTSETSLFYQGIDTANTRPPAHNSFLYPYVDEKIDLALQKQELIRQKELSAPEGIYNLQDLNLPYIPEQFGHLDLSALSAEQADTILSYYTDLKPSRRNRLALDEWNLRHLARDLARPIGRSSNTLISSRINLREVLLQEVESLERETKEVQLEAARLKVKTSSLLWNFETFTANEQELAIRAKEEQKVTLLTHEAQQLLDKADRLRRIAKTFEKNNN